MRSLLLTLQIALLCRLHAVAVAGEEARDRVLSALALHRERADEERLHVEAFAALDPEEEASSAEGADTIVWLAAREQQTTPAGRFWFDRCERPTAFRWSGPAARG